MGNYAKAAARAVRTLTEQEQVSLLRVSGEARDGFRDHVIFSLALGTGLREHEHEHELVALLRMLPRERDSNASTPPLLAETRWDWMKQGWGLRREESAGLTT